MRLSHFAKLEVIVPKVNYNPSILGTVAELKTVGMAQNITVEDNFGSRAENTIGTPLPVLAPGYQQTTLNIEKATIDGADFRNLGAFNPLWAHIGKVYTNQITGGALSLPEIRDAATSGMFPFMFIVRTRNKISGNSSFSNITDDNLPSSTSSTNNRTNSFGIYACVLSSATISATSQQAVIMDRITAIARPINGTWLNQTIRTAFASNSTADDAKNGMSQVIYDVMYGYFS
jgi:hypothetical protein